MSEFKVEAVRIGKIDKHPDADSLSITEIQGCPVIFKTGGFFTGDLAAYVPIDSMVPVARPEFEFLKNKDKPREYERIKAKKLRGIFSMGMLVPLPFRPYPKWDYFQITDPRSYVDGDDVKDVLGVVKFEEEPEEIVQNKGNLLVRTFNKYMWKLFKATGHARAKQYSKDRNHDSGPFPYYDLESARRYGHFFKEGEEVVLTEKIHGQNGRFGWVKGEFKVASHGSYKDPEGDSNWAVAAKKFDLKTKLLPYPDLVLYGEVYGVGANGSRIQHLDYGMKEIGFRIFDVYDLTSRYWFDHDAIVELAQKLDLQTVPVLYRGKWTNLEDLGKLAEGNTTVVNGSKTVVVANHIREGWVARPVVERIEPHFGRLVLKFVGQAYLLSGKRTEKH